MKPKKYPPMTNLQWLRIRAAMTQSDLAKIVGVSYVQISNYETGRARPRPRMLKRLARALQVTIEDLEEN